MGRTATILSVVILFSFILLQASAEELRPTRAPGDGPCAVHFGRPLVRGSIPPALVLRNLSRRRSALARCLALDGRRSSSVKVRLVIPPSGAPFAPAIVDGALAERARRCLFEELGQVRFPPA